MSGRQAVKSFCFLFFRIGQVFLAPRPKAAADTDGARLVWAGRSAARIGIAGWGGGAYLSATLALSA